MKEIIDLICSCAPIAAIAVAIIAMIFARRASRMANECLLEDKRASLLRSHDEAA